MKLDDLKIEVSFIDVDGFLDVKCYVYDGDSGEHVTLDKTLVRFVVTTLTQCAQKLAMSNDITELSTAVQYSINNGNSDGMGASQNKTKDLNKDS